MTRLTNVQRIIIEDFQEEDRDTVSKLANILNYYMTQNTDIINGRLDYDNINKELVTLEVTVDAKGTPIQATNFSSSQGLIGGTVLRAQNLTNSVIFPLSQPFVSFTPIQAGLYRVSNITGLQPNNKYRLTYEVTY
jgi:hypothetical protein